ncbi:MAG: tetratricopeptide repeat protein [Planctomycetota bacterium]
MLGLVVAFLAACGSTRLEPWDPRPGPYDALDDASLAELDDVRVEFDRGDLDEALSRVRALLAANPKNLFVASFAQDVELEWLRQGRSLPELDRALAASTLPDEGAPAVRLRRWYRLRAESDRSAFRLVLAARAEDDGVAALRLLDEAIATDPACVWAHFGRAFVLLQQGDLAACKQSLDRAIALDPGHPRVRRLEATLLEKLAQGELAYDLLVTWTREVASDPRVSDGELIDAHLDLASFELLVEKDPEAALLRLSALRTDDPGRNARLALIESTCHADLEDYESALDAARRARLYAPSNYLSWQQEALLLQRGVGDLEGALEAWRTVAELASERSGTDPSAARAGARGERDDRAARGAPRGSPVRARG